MKIHYLSAVAMMAAFLSFGQTQQPVGAQNIQAPTTSPQQHIQTHDQSRSVNTVAAEQLPLAPSSATPHSCAMHDLNEQHYAERGLLQEYHQSAMQGAQSAATMNFPETSGTNEISVIFHVVYNPNNPAENVSNANIMALFQELQEDYLLLNTDAANARTGLGFIPVNTNINFCLATQDPLGNPLTEVGVTRVSTTEDYYDHSGGEENKMKYTAQGGDDIWDRNKYLNVWICNITNGLNYGVAGYAFRPTPTLLPSSDIDGIVIDYNIGFGSNVLTHEVGHYLGLDHTWGGSGSCANDDGFTDTPNTIGPADNETNFTCGMASFQTCGVEVQYENYMDYATGCTVMFTQEQANYMLSILQGIRSSLLLSPGCDPTNTPPNSAFSSFPAGPSPVIIPQNASVNFYDQSTNAPTGWAWTISGTQGTDWQWIGGTSATSQDPVAEFYTVGTYDVTLTASNSYGTDATPASEPMYVQVASAATGIGCDTLRNWDTAAGAGSVGWSTPSAGYVNGHALIGTSNAFEWAQPMSSPTTTDIKAIEYAAAVVSDGGGDVIWKIYADGGTQPGAVLGADTVAIADITQGAWNQINMNPPVTGITGNFWVGFEITYTNPLDTFVLYSQVTSAGANTDWWYDGTAWEDIATTTGNAAGTHSLVDVLTSTGGDPSMDFTATGDSVCQGGDILVDGSISTNNEDYRWYIDDTFPLSSPVLENSTSSSNTFNFPYSPGTYYMYLFGDGSCITDGVYLPIEVLPNVSATVTPTATTCGYNNGSITVTAPSGGDGTNYFYSLDGVNYQTSNTFTGLAPGDYDVYVATYWNNCYEMYTVNVATSTGPTATATASQAICPGASASITASGGVSYVWSDGTTTVGTNATESVSPATTTQYSCLVTDGSGCQTTVYTTVSVNTPIQPTITASGSTTICAGTTVDLTSSTPTGNVWSTAETSSTITVGTSGQYTVTSPDANGCSATSNPIDIVVLTAPAISAGTVNGPSSCGTATGTIEITGATSGDVVWTGTSSGNSGGPVSLPYTITGLAAGSYNVVLTDANGCVSNLVAQPLSDPNPPTTPTIVPSGATTFCDGDSVVLTSSYTGGNAWTTGESTDAITVNSTQTISVTYTDINGCSATSNPISIVMNANPTAPTVTPSGATTFCDGGSVTLSSSQGTGNVWSTTETTQNIVVSTSGTYSVTYTNTNGCSATSATVDVVVNTNPTAPTITPSGATTFCDGGSVTLSSSQGTGNVWSTTETTQDIVVNASGSFTVTYTDGNGCSATSTTTDVIVNALPTVTLDPLSDVCDYTTPFSISGGTPSGGTYSGAGISGGQFDPSAAGLGTHTITYEYTDGNGCSNTAQQDILVDACISVQELTHDGLSIFPNPTEGMIYVEMSGEFTYEIVDARGRKIVDGQATDKANISMSHVEAGVYFVNVSNEGKTIATRIVKQ